MSRFRSLLCMALLAGSLGIPPALAAEGASAAEQDPATQQEPKKGLWRRLWPRHDDPGVPAEAAPEAASDAGAPVTRRLALTQQRLRDSRVAQDPTGRRFLDLVDGDPTAAQLNEFGIWLAGQGLLDASQEYFRAALALDRGDPDVWNNLGMVQVRLGQSGARSSFQRAIALEPTHALAHYNLGTMLDADGAYDAAIEEFTRALTLDPRLGDPAFNPQAVSNPRLLVVRLGLYGSRAKTLGIPMKSVPGGKAPDGRK